MTYPEEYYTRMMKEAYELWEEAQQDAECTVLMKTGGLDFGNPDGLDFSSVIEAANSHNLQQTTISPEEALASFGITIPEGHIAIHNANAGILLATKSCKMFQDLARKHGAILLDETEVLDVNNDDGIPGSETVKNHFCIRTSKGIFKSKNVVFATGPWTSKFIKKSFGKSLPIHPLHTTAVYWDAHGFLEKYQKDGKYPVFINYEEPFVYGMMSPEHPGLLKICLHSGIPCDPETKKEDPPMEEVFKTLGPWIREKFGDLVKSDSPLLVQSCMYSMTPDQDFILDSISLSENSKVFVAAGFSGHGFKMAPLVGKVMADLIMTGNSDSVPLEMFSIKRFEGNENGNKKNIGPQVKWNNLD